MAKNNFILNKEGVLQFYKGEKRLQMYQATDETFILCNPNEEVSIPINKDDIDDLILLLNKIKEKDYFIN
ncbi:hypothetical protein CVD28_02605 [Bacillus sp. M6-12]|uniref:hypothetical protein n=1 Tax=Bacillus sp. M6-12 TaxID=2054166 RepID=UPI000C7599B8|nr:hypothetical protein [Bacillus sp. M6-12]PLS19323.1 hypothetical protein CVD28_02605 [Bacillus sp. M6-12]